MLIVCSTIVSAPLTSRVVTLSLAGNNRDVVETMHVSAGVDTFCLNKV